MIASTLSVLLWLGPPVLPPDAPTSAPPPPVEPASPPADPPPADPVPPDKGPVAPTDIAPIVVEPRPLPPGIEPVEFPLEQGTARAPVTHEPLPRMEASPSTERRSIVELRDPFARPQLRRTGSMELAHQRLMMPELKDPFAEGTRPVRSHTLDLQVPSELRDPFRDGLGRPRVGPCQRTTQDGTRVQAPNAPTPECPSGTQGELLDPFRDGKAGAR